MAAGQPVRIVPDGGRSDRSFARTEIVDGRHDAGPDRRRQPFGGALCRNDQKKTQKENGERKILKKEAGTGGAKFSEKKA